MTTESKVSGFKMFWIDTAFALGKRLRDAYKWTLKHSFSVKSGNRLSTLRLFLLCLLS